MKFSQPRIKRNIGHPEQILFPVRRRGLGAGACFCFLLLALSAAFSQRARCEEIVFAFYNVENYQTAAEGGHTLPASQPTPPPKPEASVAAVVRVIAAASPQILGLAEMGGGAAIADLRARLKAVGLDYPHVEWVEGADADRHLALLSQFPIVEAASRADIPFDLDGRLRRVSRGVLDATVDLGRGRRLRLVGAHWKSRRDTPGFDQAQFRAREAELLRKDVEKILAVDPDVWLLVFGDLNDTKNEFPVRELLGPPGSARRLTPLPLTDGRQEFWTHYWKTADIYSRIDYILASPALVARVDAERSGILDAPDWDAASDHRLIFTTLMLDSP